MNPPHAHSLTFCPSCGCNVATVAAALQFSALQSQPASPRSIKQVREITSRKRATRRAWSPQDVKLVVGLRKDRVAFEDIARQLDRPISSVRAQFYAKRPKLALKA